MNVAKVRLQLKKVCTGIPKLPYSSTEGNQKSFIDRTQNLKHYIQSKSVELKLTKLQSRSLYFDKNKISPVNSVKSGDDDTTNDSLDDSILGNPPIYVLSSDVLDESDVLSDDDSDTINTPLQLRYRHLHSDSSEESSVVYDDSVLVSRKRPRFNENPGNSLKIPHVLSDKGLEESSVVYDDNVLVSRKRPRFNEKPGSSLKIPRYEADLSLNKSMNPKWPVDTSKSECIRRDDVIRSYITKHDWYVSAEFHLIRTLVMKPPSYWISYSRKYPFIFDFEWVNEEGKGDLIYTDGNNNFLVIEVKSIGWGSGRTHQTKKRQKRRDGEKQTEKYSWLWHKKNPQVNKTIGVFVTNHSAQEITCFTR